LRGIIDRIANPLGWRKKGKKMEKEREQADEKRIRRPLQYVGF
jgi:hypothetical protein